MTKLFPDWADIALGIVTWGGLITLVLLCGGLFWYYGSPYHTNLHVPYTQPVEFDHRHHVQDDGISCLYCHQTVLTSATAGLPATELCMDCHSQIWNESPPIQRLFRSFATGLPLHWRRVNAVPDYVYFNHAIHSAKGVGCVVCHGRVDEMARVYQVRNLSMSWCLNCHRDPAPYLRDPSLIFSMSWQPPADRRRYGREIARRLGVKQLTDCYTCHR